MAGRLSSNMKGTVPIQFLLGISIWALLPGSGISASNSSGPGPLRIETRGVYFLTAAEGIRQVDLTRLACWDNPNIIGVALRATWEAVEPSPGQFDWSFIDEGLRIAKSKRKFIAISVVAGIRSPDWIFRSATILRLTGRDSKHRDATPAPWDPNYLGAWRRFVQAFGLRYDGNPLISYVTATGFGRGEECHLLDDPGDAGQFDPDRWMAAATEIVSDYNSAFKETPWFVAWGQPVLRQNQLMIDLYTRASGFGLKANTLSPSYPNPSSPVGQTMLRMSRTRPIVFQALRPSKDPRMLAAVLETGERMGMQAFECYPIDANDPASQGVLAAGNRAMRGR